MLFYYTATGNSLYVARQLVQKPISIPQAIREGNLAFSNRTIGIVCPVFCGQMPPTVLRFIEKATFITDYFYFIFTYGNGLGNAREELYERMKKMGRRVDYVDAIKMVDNYLPEFDMSKEKQIDNDVAAQIEAVRKNLSACYHSVPEQYRADKASGPSPAYGKKTKHYMNIGKPFKITAACKANEGCSACVGVCPKGNYSIENGKAIRRNDVCEFCLACVQNCPEKAIKVRRADKNPNERYRNVNVTLEDIIESNNQNKH